MGSYYQRVTRMLAERRREATPPLPPSRRREPAKTRMSKRVLLYSLGIFATALLITYLVDYVVLQYRIRTGKVPFDQVMVTTYYAIHQKNGKTDYSMQDPQPEGCVDSLLPHLGMPPCWYLRRHPEKRIDI